MANGLDRLERFLTYRRKGSTAASESDTIVTAICADNTPNMSPEGRRSEPQFPSPSFIRPKDSRMAAREEVRVRQPSARSASPSEISGLRHKSSTHHRNSSGTSHSSQSRTLTIRTSPFVAGNYGSLFPSLQDYQFPKPPREGSTSDTRSKAPGQVSPRTRSPPCLAVTIPSSRWDTPPSSEPEDNSPSRETTGTKQLPAIPHEAPPTPGESPKLGHYPDYHLRTSKSVDLLDQASLCRAIHKQLKKPHETANLRRSCSHSALSASALPDCRSSTLREPDFNDFLTLSDDDIAEVSPESGYLPSTTGPDPSLLPMPLSINRSTSLNSVVLTLAPPHRSSAATAAAFEAARIANRYSFDLIYVVNLWPGAVPILETSETGFEVKGEPPARPMFGRLLAAHGLHHVSSPLQISSVFHTTALRSGGWIEYCNPDAEPSDLARGYACAFHPGQYTGSGSSCLDTRVSGVKMSEKIDSGIVFAAYRKGRPGGDKMGASMRSEQLGWIHQDAEALVEMLLDIHVADRLRQPSLPDEACHETGPIPMHQHQLP